MSAPTVRLGEIASLQAGIGFPSALQGRSTGDFPFAKVGDISRCGRSDSSVLSTADHYVDQADVTQLRAKLIPAGSILFAKIGEAIRQNHRVIAGCDMLIDNNAMAAVPSDRVDGRFLYNYLKTVDFYALAPATTVPALRKSELEILRVPLPPLEEQRRIAAILDQAETLRTQRRQALAHLDTLTQSLFLDMFGDPVANPKGWAVCKLENIASKITDGTHKTPAYTVSGVEFLSAKDIKDRRIVWGTGKYISEQEHAQLIKRCDPELGDLLLAKSGSLGSVAIIDRVHQFSLFESLCLIKHARDLVDGVFLASMLQANSMQSYLLGRNKGVAIKHLHLVDIRSLKVVLPPLALQQAFATRIQAIEAIKATHRTALAQLDALFASLQHRAFAGEL